MAIRGRCLDDGHSLHDLLLVHLGPGSVHLSHDVSNAGLVAKKGGHVHVLLYLMSDKLV